MKSKWFIYVYVQNKTLYLIYSSIQNRIIRKFNSHKMKPVMSCSHHFLKRQTENGNSSLINKRIFISDMQGPITSIQVVSATTSRPLIVRLRISNSWWLFLAWN